MSFWESSELVLHRHVSDCWWCILGALCAVGSVCWSALIGNEWPHATFLVVAALMVILRRILVCIYILRHEWASDSPIVVVCISAYHMSCFGDQRVHIHWNIRGKVWIHLLNFITISLNVYTKNHQIYKLKHTRMGGMPCFDQNDWWWLILAVNLLSV